MREDAGPSSQDGLFRGKERPRIITISGANKDVGKSSLAAFLAGHCRCCAGMKVSIHEERPAGESIIQETEPPASRETDTARMLLAGARPVLWVRSTGAGLYQDLRTALSRIEAPVIIVEGNSVLDYLDPDYAVFIMEPTFSNFKPSAHAALARADTVIVNGEENLGGERLLELEGKIKERNPRAKMIAVGELGRERTWEIVLSRAVGALGGECMVSDLDERIKQAVREKSREGRIACAVALKLAEELGVPPREVGKAANEINIKITSCSLGCF